MPRRKSSLAGVDFKVTAPLMKCETPDQAGWRYAADTGERFNMLCAHYKIPRDENGMLDFFQIAMHLADEFIPAFRPNFPATPGKKPSPATTVRDLELFADLLWVENLGRSVKNHAKHLVKPGRRYEGKSWATLLKRYYRLKAGKTPESRRMVKLLVDVAHRK